MDLDHRITPDERLRLAGIAVSEFMNDSPAWAAEKELPKEAGHNAGSAPGLRLDLPKKRG